MIYALLYPRIEFTSAPNQKEQAKPIWSVLQCVIALEFGKFPIAEIVHFQRTYCTPKIVRMDLYRSLRVNFYQVGIKYTRLRFYFPLQQPLTKLNVCRRSMEEPPHERSDIKSGPTDHYGDSTCCNNAIDGRPCVTHVVSDAIRLVRLYDVDHMMVYKLTLFRYWLSRADIHATVY